jgi:beta-galactosidase GanA
MQAAGINVVRMGEFAWSTMEPAAGKFNFSWLELAIDKLAAHGADAVLYWQWRSAFGGQEEYHGTLIDQSG